MTLARMLASLLLAAAAPAALAAAPATVTAAGVTLHSVSVELPADGRTMPGGEKAELVNQNCLACHTAGMILTQPPLSKATWEEEVNKMRNAYKAPVAAEDVAGIVAYLVSIKGVD